MDDTDIFTLNRIGCLALRIKRPILAQYAFQRCQELNPNHWLSMNGLLDALCESQSIGAAYGQAVHCLSRNPSHRKAIDVLLEIHEDFPEMVPMLQKVYKNTNFSVDGHSHSGNEKFFTIKFEEEPENETKIGVDTSEFQLEQLDWMSVGKLITRLHAEIVDKSLNPTQIFHFHEFYQEKRQDPCHIEGLSDLSPDEMSKNSFPEPSPGMFDLFNHEDLLEIPMTPGNTITELNGTEVPENPEPVADPGENETEVADVNQNESTVQSENTDTEGKKVEDPDVAALKSSDSKRRRRGSELTVLEQWGWHKNRRSNRKKVEQAPVEQIDPTINGFLRRILPQYFEKSFDTTSSLAENNNNDTATVKDTAENEIKNASKITNNLEEFHNITKETLDKLISELQNDPFDIFTATQKYLQHLSSLWAHHMPPELRQVFMDVHEIYRTFVDYDTLNLLTDEELEFNVRIALFYLELVINTQETNVSSHILKLCTILRFYVGFFLFNDCYLEFSSRLLWIYVWMNVNQNNFEEALDYLENVS